MSAAALARALAATAVLAGAGAAIAAVGPPRDPGARPAAVELARASAPLEVHNSRHGRAVIAGRNMAPGEVSRGTVEVRVGSRARVALAADRIALEPGPNGGRLAEALTLRVRAIGGGSGAYRTVYEGPPARMGAVDLGRWRARDHYRFRIRVRLDGGPRPQNSLQGARTAFRLVWNARR